MEFSEEQKKAINCTTKNILVTARAGSGKTRVLTERAKRLLKNGVLQDEILIFAFNNKAVDEVNERLGLKIAKTFHSFSNDFANLKVGRNNSDIFDRMVREATEKISRRDVAKIKHILVDEFQDFTELFFNLIQRILKLNSEINFFAVGDDWQHIYSFAGAKVEFFRHFERYFSPVKRHTLTTNFRSKKAIVEHGNRIMGSNSAKSVSDGGVVENISDFREVKKIINSKVDKNRVAIISGKNKELFQLKQVIEIDHENLFFVTAHSSKGLQFDIVILFENTFWNDKSIWYVASTRAKNELYIYDNFPYLADKICLDYLEKSILSKTIFFILRLSPDRKIIDLVESDSKKLQGFLFSIFQTIKLEHIRKIVSTFHRYDFSNLSIEEIEKLQKIRNKVEIDFDKYDFLEAKEKWSLAFLSYNNSIKYKEIKMGREEKSLELFIWNGNKKIHIMESKDFKEFREQYSKEQTQDEFETKAELQHRITEEALNYYSGEQNISMRYDADEVAFSVEEKTYSIKFKVDVPRDIAQDFKESVKNFDFYFNESFEVVEVSAEFFGEKYFGKDFKKDILFEIERKRERKREREREREPEIASKTITVGKLMFQDFDLPELMNWKSACEYCEKLRLLGFSNWRLPNKDELKTAYRNKKEFKNLRSETSSYWSISKNDSSFSWIVDFDGGYDLWDVRTSSYFAVCVRDL
ncbi:DNA/RNA helicase, superfamily I [Thiovulum sp. ES]|nr:DNA/RNA helicase, superfamily I [Thiovulum sp. ES]